MSMGGRMEKGCCSLKMEELLRVLLLIINLLGRLKLYILMGRALRALWTMGRDQEMGCLHLYISIMKGSG